MVKIHVLIIPMYIYIYLIAVKSSQVRYVNTYLCNKLITLIVNYLGSRRRKYEVLHKKKVTKVKKTS
jgi:hypothetical protein